MEKLIVLALIVICFFSACKKDVTIPTTHLEYECGTPSPISYFHLNYGSYWVYDWYVIDSLGNETFLNITDSIFISGDTTIGNSTYSISEGTWFGGSPFVEYLRDSSFHLVNEAGRVFCSSTNFTDTLHIWNSMNGDETGFLKMAQNTSSVTVPAGTFTSLNAVYTVVNNVGTWPCIGALDIHNNFYSEYVGKVKSTFQITGDNSCKVYEQRLRDYLIN